MKLHVLINGNVHKLSLEEVRDQDRLTKQDASQAERNFVFEIEGKRYTASAYLLGPGILSLLVRTRSYRCVLDTGGVEPTIYVDGQGYRFAIEDPRSIRTRHISGSGEKGSQSVKAPMPGRIIRVLTEVGAEVVAQQGIVVVEAMKMQNELKAPKAGKVTKLPATPGAVVNAGEVLAVIE